MNERIEELFGKALDQAVPETWTTLNPAQLSKLKDKFAELIVRECCDVLYDNEMGGYQVNYVLKEHFGVEE